jgi:dipeptidyl aminopeptidase/acylaminoacyl peptidase
VWTRLGSANPPQPLLTDVLGRSTGSFLPDGKTLAFVTRRKDSATATQIFTVAITEENGRLKAGTPELFSPPQFSETDPEFSPDGQWIALVLFGSLWGFLTFLRAQALCRL